MNRLSSVLAVILVTFNLWAHAASGLNSNRGDVAETRRRPEIWLCMRNRVFDLLDPDAEWPFVKEHISGIQFYIDMVNKAPSEKLKQFVQLIQKQKYQVAIECGGTLDFAPMNSTNGERSAAIELAKIDKFYAAGGKVDFLNIDGPIRRLMHPKSKRRGSFDSVEKAADELVDYLRIVRRAHPELHFFLLTNFPNWGYRGDVSYHARGPARQDYGDYDTVVKVVLTKLEAANIPLTGVTVDNPYEYLVGSHMSVKLEDPTSVDWIARVRRYEDFARSAGLKFNLIANSEAGGRESDESFYNNTLRMVDTYIKAGGRPDRWFIQSWYEHPVQVVPESAKFSMTALIKAAVRRIEASQANRRTRRESVTSDNGRIVLAPRQDSRLSFGLSKRGGSLDPWRTHVSKYGKNAFWVEDHYWSLYVYPF